MKIALLPLYLQLYDETIPHYRKDVTAFRDLILERLQALGLDVFSSDICRTRSEVESAIKLFESKKAAAVVTLHLAYSPSLAAAPVLAKTDIPLAILDTTQKYSFDESSDFHDVMLNHGIHGVQDLCNILLREGKPYSLFAGHYEQSDVLSRVAAFCKGAVMAAAMKGAKVGIVGMPFEGMGDFHVPRAVLKDVFDIDVVSLDLESFRSLTQSIAGQAIQHEIALDRDIFTIEDAVTDSLHEKTTRVGLALKSWIKEHGFTGFSVNFLATGEEPDKLPLMPFVACSKAMGDGIGYAGEGDVLTAAFVGALMKIFPDTSFSEMFCPDWQGESVLLSHMGEWNYRLAKGKPLLAKMNFDYTSAGDTTVAYGLFKQGKAVLCNIAPLADGKFRMLFAPGAMLDKEGSGTLEHAVRGWFKPDTPLIPFLEQFSYLGGTHHSALVYTDSLDELTAFANSLGMEHFIL